MEIIVHNPRFLQLQRIRNIFLLAAFVLCGFAILLNWLGAFDEQSQATVVAGFIMLLFSLPIVISLFLFLFGKTSLEITEDKYYVSINAQLTENGELFGVKSFGHFVVAKEESVRFMITCETAVHLFYNTEMISVVEEKEMSLLEGSPMMIIDTVANMVGPG